MAGKHLVKGNNEVIMSYEAEENRFRSNLEVKQECLAQSKEIGRSLYESENRKKITLK